MHLGLLAREYTRLGYAELAEPLMCGLAEFDINYRYTNPDKPVVVDSLRISDEEALKLYKREQSSVLDWLYHQASKGITNAKG